MVDDLYIGIGRKIEERRRAIRLTREALAAKANPPLSGKYLWEIETG